MYRYTTIPYRMNLLNLSQDLRKINNNIPISKIIVTEAGIVPYYSEIPAIDAYGLNTKKYSTKPLIHEDEAIKEDPCIILNSFRPNTLSKVEQLSKKHRITKKETLYKKNCEGKGNHKFLKIDNYILT